MPKDDPEINRTFELETRHIPILQSGIPESKLTPMQRVTLEFNRQRDIAAINGVLDSVRRGHDAVHGAHHVHILPMRRAMERAGGILITDGL